MEVLYDQACTRICRVSAGLMHNLPTTSCYAEAQYMEVLYHQVKTRVDKYAYLWGEGRPDAAHWLWCRHPGRRMTECMFFPC